MVQIIHILKNAILRKVYEKLSFLSVLFHAETLFPDLCDMKDCVFTEYYGMSQTEHS